MFFVIFPVFSLYLLVLACNFNSSYLGIQITDGQDKITISQEAYIKEVLVRFKITNMSPKSLLMRRRPPSGTSGNQDQDWPNRIRYLSKRSFREAMSEGECWNYKLVQLNTRKIQEKSWKTSCHSLKTTVLLMKFEFNYVYKFLEDLFLAGKSRGKNRFN